MRKSVILVNVMFCRLDKFDGPIFEGAVRGCVYVRGLIFEMLIGLHIWGEYIRGGFVNGILLYMLTLAIKKNIYVQQDYLGTQ